MTLTQDSQDRVHPEEINKMLQNDRAVSWG